MTEGQKVQVVFEFSRAEYDAYLFLVGCNKDEEAEAVWREMSKEPCPIKPELLGEEERQVRLLIVSWAILSVQDSVEKNIQG